MNLRIEHDDDAQAPSDWADPSEAFLMGWHSREFWVPPPGVRYGGGPVDPNDWLARFKATHKFYMIEAYIHSGVRIARNQRGRFPDRRWDVCENIGCVAVPKGETDHDDIVDSIIAEWNQYLSGDVWGYIIEEDDGTQVDSCWGIYGHEEAVQAGREAMRGMEA